MSDQSQGPGWWVASDGKWYPPEQHPGGTPPPPPTGEPATGEPATGGPPTWAAPTGGPPTGGAPPRPIYRKPWFIISAAAAILVLILAIAAATSGSSSKEKVLSGPSSGSSSSSESSSRQQSSSQTTTATTAKAVDLAVESGFSSWLNSIGTRYSSAGAAITNPNSGQAAYDVTAVFNLVDATGKVLDTESVTVPYIAPGARVLAAPLQIGFGVNGEPTGVNVTAIGEFKKDTGPTGSNSFSLNKGIPLTVTGAEIQKDQYFSKVTGQVMNPSSDIVKYASLTCVHRAGGTIVGGTATSITDPIAPGATIAFNAGTGDLPPNADATECTAIG